MTIEPLAAVAPSLAPLATTAAETSATTSDFASRIADHLSGVSNQITEAQAGVTRLATGETGNLHQVLLDLSRAKLAFQVTLEIRNKVLEGYQDIMRMQI